MISSSPRVFSAGAQQFDGLRTSQRRRLSRSMETVDASAVMLAFIVAVSLATLLMIIRVQSVLQDVLKAAIELASAKPATAAAETQTEVQDIDIWRAVAVARFRPWDALSPGCQHAVDSLGYSPELWDAEAAVAARRFQEIGGTGFGRFPEPRRAQARLRLHGTARNSSRYNLYL